LRIMVTVTQGDGRCSAGGVTRVAVARRSRWSRYGSQFSASHSVVPSLSVSCSGQSRFLLPYLYLTTPVALRCRLPSVTATSCSAGCPMSVIVHRADFGDCVTLSHPLIDRDMVRWTLPWREDMLRGRDLCGEAHVRGGGSIVRPDVHRAGPTRLAVVLFQRANRAAPETACPREQRPGKDQPVTVVTHAWTRTSGDP
jgi:hypothetical protein